MHVGTTLQKKGDGLRFHEGTGCFQYPGNHIVCHKYVCIHTIRCPLEPDLSLKCVLEHVMVNVDTRYRHPSDAQSVQFGSLEGIVVDQILIPGNGTAVIGIAMDIEMVTADCVTVSQVDVVSGLVSLVWIPGRMDRVPGIIELVGFNQGIGILIVCHTIPISPCLTVVDRVVVNIS